MLGVKCNVSDVDLLPAEDDQVPIPQHSALWHQLVIHIHQQMDAIAVPALPRLDAASGRKDVTGSGARCKVLNLATCESSVTQQTLYKVLEVFSCT